MFISGEVLLDAGFHDAWTRLSDLVHGHVLVSASQDAYGRAVAGVCGAGASGGTARVSRLVEVQFRDMVTREESAVLALRWKAIGPSGSLFPALDADIILTPGDQQATLLKLHGVYRTPPGSAERALEHGILQRIATETIQAFLNRLAEAVAHPARADRG